MSAHHRRMSIFQNTRGLYAQAPQSFVVGRLLHPASNACLTEGVQSDLLASFIAVFA
jgi:hypothetical protein